MSELISNKVKSILYPHSVLFFDMDGTLIETTYLNNYAYREAFNTVMGYPLPETNEDRITRELIRELPEINENKFKDIVAEKERLYLKHLYFARPISHTVDLLWTFSMKHKSYLVTKCHRDRAEITLLYFGFHDRFAGISSSSNENKYEEAITRFGINPQHIIAFENDEKEIKDGLKAGISMNNIIKIDKQW